MPSPFDTTQRSRRQWLKFLTHSLSASHSRRYPWNEWLDGRPWKLEVGVDFTAKVSTFKQMAKAQAQRRGGRLPTVMQTEGDKQYLAIQFQK